MTLAFGLTIAIISTVIGAFGSFFLKKGSSSLSWKNIHKNHYLFLGIFLTASGVFTFIPSLKFGDLSILYPVTALTYVWSVILAKVYLNENITRLRVIGLLLVLCGIVLTVIR